MASGPSRVSRSRTGADPSAPEPTSTGCSASGALTGTACWSATPSASQATTCAQDVDRDHAELGRHVEQLALPGRRSPGLEPGALLLEPGHQPRQDRPVRAGQQQQPVGQRTAPPGAWRGRGCACAAPCRASYWKPGVCRNPSSGRLEAGLAEAVERLALAQEGAPGQARVPADERRRTAGRLRAAAWHAARVAPSRMPTAGHGGRAEVEEVLAGRLDAGQPGRHPVGVVLEAGGVTGAVVVEAERDDAGRGQLLGQPAEGPVRGAALLPHRRAEDRRRRGPGRRPGGRPSRRADATRWPEPHLGVLGPVVSVVTGLAHRLRSAR